MVRGAAIRRDAVSGRPAIEYTLPIVQADVGFTVGESEGKKKNFPGRTEYDEIMKSKDQSRVSEDPVTGDKDSLDGRQTKTALTDKNSNTDDF
jgi:hypothetical protein